MAAGEEGDHRQQRALGRLKNGQGRKLTTQDLVRDNFEEANRSQLSSIHFNTTCLPVEYSMGLIDIFKPRFAINSTGH